MRGTGKKRKPRGFTLLELLVAISVASLLLTVGIPSFRTLIMNTRIIGETNDFVTAINTARSSAVRYQRNATICVSSNFDAALPTCEAGTDWSSGWIVWVDKDRDDATDTDEILSAHEPLADTTTFFSTTTNQFTYDARGFGMVAGDDLILCDSRTGETGRVVTVNDAGRISLAEFACP